MFYEIKEKRVKTGSQTKWWLTAAFSAVILTTIFIGLIFWLGVNVRQPESTSFVDRHSSFREYQQYIAPKPTAAPALKPDYPTAEILKTTIKNKKGRVEMVEVSNEKVPSKSSSTSSTSKTFSPETTTTNTQTSLEIEIDDEVDAYSIEQQSPDAQLKSKIAKLSTAQMEYETGTDRGHLQDGINPVEESSSVPSAENNSVKKKSEAVLPSWFDPSLHQSSNPKVEPSNHLKQDSVYDIPDFSQIKPDLSAFNTKTIPAFTYLKEPLPPFKTPSDDASNEDSSVNVDESYYYQQATKNDDPQFVNNNKVPENSFLTILQKRLHNMQDWLLYGGKKNNSSVDLMEFVKAVNTSFPTKNFKTIFSKLKDFYMSFNSSDLQGPQLSSLLPTSSSILSNSSSLVSFGLLAIDLFLLHNVQQIVWNEEAKIGEEMLRDPDVVAMNALFMSPDRIHQLRSTNSRILTDREKKGVVHDILEFINGGLRAVLNLSKAYKSSTTQSSARSQSNGSTLDCIWTLYCRNLDKTAKLHGPYGFLAKMNSLGLRVMMGEFPMEKAFERLVNEYNGGWRPLQCDKLFPRCGADEAKEVVIQTVLGRAPVQK